MDSVLRNHKLINGFHFVVSISFAIVAVKTEEYISLFPMFFMCSLIEILKIRKIVYNEIEIKKFMIKE